MKAKTTKPNKKTMFNKNSTRQLSKENRVQINKESRQHKPHVSLKLSQCNDTGPGLT